MSSMKIFILLGLLAVLFISSEVSAAKDLAEKTKETKENNGVEDAKYGGYNRGGGYNGGGGYNQGGGGYNHGGGGGYNNGGGGGYNNGGGGYNNGGGGYNNGGGGYNNGGGGYNHGGGGGGYNHGGGGGRYCRYGCCYRGNYGCQRCCGYAGEASQDAAKP